ncbi:hypothetical protein GCM10010343_75850 [Streptomyces avidinii]|uniref:Relaxase/mobilization nuclease-like protein n=2 Tax=Streptomyces avidinii TaxID=1895 RepID=A0ABS4KW53_STRAV|nr:hypothetical protein [Streptomyces avidinii]MBP2034225.1 hypothetical protein [Streptomyces avidinii]GGZ37670.1 hypothetical protein GCM10010343_75850 [Streptomyces avidinii]
MRTSSRAGIRICPARAPARMTLPDLALLLDAPVDALRGERPAEHIWHVAVRNHPGDRILSDAEWGEVAVAMVAAAGIAGHGDEQACRWIAVRHAPDHIHLLATLARQDGRHPRLRGDILAMHAAARAFEARWGLTEMSPLDRTARRRPVTGEAEKAARRGLAETAREPLQRTVRRAAAWPTTMPISWSGSVTSGWACASAVAMTVCWWGTRWRCPAIVRTAACARCGSRVRSWRTTCPWRGSASVSPRTSPRPGRRWPRRVSVRLSRTGCGRRSAVIAAAHPL